MIKGRRFYTIADVSWLLSMQNYMVRSVWSNFQTSFSGIEMKVTGKWFDEGYENTYHFEIIYNPIGSFKVKIIKPIIIPASSIHMYSNGNLCLYHWRDYSLDRQFSLAHEIIPWTLEWTFWYEIWLKNGNIWKGTEAPHG